MNRRAFFKTVAAAAVVAVAAPAVVAPAVVVTNGTDKSVVWNTAGWDWPGGTEPLLYVSHHRNRSAHMFCVVATAPIKRGRTLIWNPDGTVRGA